MAGTYDLRFKDRGGDNKCRIIKTVILKEFPELQETGRQRKMLSDVGLPGFKFDARISGFGTYYHQWTHWEDGRQLDKIGTYPGLSPDSAREIILKRIELIAQRIDPNGSDDEVIPNIDDFINEEILPKLDEWYSRPATQRSQARKWLLRYFSGKRAKPLNRITRRDIVRFLEWVAENGSKTTATRCKSFLSVIMNRALGLEYVDRNVCLGVKGYREPESRTRIFSDDEYVRYAKTVVEHIEHQHAKILYLLLLIPLRFMEVAAMQWSRVDLERETYFIPADLSKNRRARTIALNQPAIELLTQMSSMRDPSVDWVFPAKSESGHTEDIRNQFKKILEVAGITDFRVHDIRRSGASALLNDFDANPMKIMEILGHRDMKSTLVYARLSAKSMAQTSGQLGQKFEEAVNA